MPFFFGKKNADSASKTPKYQTAETQTPFAPVRKRHGNLTEFVWAVKYTRISTYY